MDAELPTQRRAPRNAAELCGTLRIAYIRLFRTRIRHILVDFPEVSNILCFQRPNFPPTPKWGGMRNRRPNKGAPRNAAGPGGAPKFGYATLESAIFGRPRPNYVMFSAPGPPISQRQRGEGNSKLPPKQRGAARRHGTSRRVTEHEGPPKFDHRALGSAKFRRTPSKLSNILCFRRPTRPPFPPTPMWERNAKLPTKQRARGKGAEPY